MLSTNKKLNWIVMCVDITIGTLSWNWKILCVICSFHRILFSRHYYGISWRQNFTDEFRYKQESGRIAMGNSFFGGIIALVIIYSFTQRWQTMHMMTMSFSNLNIDRCKISFAGVHCTYYIVHTHRKHQTYVLVRILK